jgi:hypothetical protein
MIARSLLVLSALLLAGAARPATVVAARGHWAALDHGALCEAAARPLPPSSERERAARAGLRFGGLGQPRFFARLSRPLRTGSSVMLRIGTGMFLLAGRGEWAWSHAPGQSDAIMAAMRGASAMRVDARDSRGQRFTDRYLLAGAPTAIDAAAAACAGKI